MYTANSCGDITPPYKLLSLTYKVLTTTQPSYLHNLITVQPPRSTRSSSLVTIARPSTSSSLRITGRSFQYASSLLSGLHLGLLQRPCSNNRLSNNRPRFVSIEPRFGKKFEELHNSVGHYYYCCVAAVWGGGTRYSDKTETQLSARCSNFYIYIYRLLQLRSSQLSTFCQ